MLYVAEIVVALDLEQAVVLEFLDGPDFSDEIEVSLDCSHCQRTGRTVRFQLGEDFGRCSPGSAARRGTRHPAFPGRIVAREVVGQDTSKVVATYRLEYEAARFADARYGPEGRPWAGHPTWARVSFTLQCTTCKGMTSDSVQNNATRPRTVLCEGCGSLLHVERREMPVLRFRDPETGEWREVPKRWRAR